MKRRQNGFSLFEMVLAIAIFSTVGLLIGGIFFSVQRAWSRIHKHAARLDELRKIDRIANSAFKNIVPFKWIDNNLRERQIFRGNTNSVTFAYLHRINQGEVGIRFLTLAVDDGKLVASYRHTPILHWLDEPDARDDRIKREILLDNVKNVGFEYADREGDAPVWYREWDDEQKNQIPLAIFMTVEFDNGSRECWLRRTAGSSFNSGWGKREYAIK